MKVLKFGGTSVGTVDSINQVVQIISENKTPVAVVYSAMGGVTNKLIEIGNLATAGDAKYLDILKNIEERHMNAIRLLIGVKSQSSIIAKIKGNFNEIEDLLKGITYIGELTFRTLDLLLSFGERLSTQIITFALNERGINAEYIDTRTIIKTNSNFGFAEVDFAATNPLIKEALSDSSKVIV